MRSLLFVIPLIGLGAAYAGPYDYSDSRMSSSAQGSNDYYYAAPNKANQAPGTMTVQIQKPVTVDSNQDINHSSQRNDADVLKSINDSLNGGFFAKSYKEIHALINNGVVTLTGFVEDEAQHKEVLDRVNKVGVRSIDDRITVQDPSMQITETRNDVKPVQNLQGKINDALKNNTWSKNYNNVNAQENNGTVIIWGVVATEGDRKDLKERITKLPGVRNLVDRLVVQSPEQRPDDSALLKQIRDALKKGVLTKGYENVHVQLNNGEVQLTGVVDTEADRKDLKERIIKIDGVNTIIDRLNLNPALTRNGSDRMDRRDPTSNASDSDSKMNEKVRSSLAGGMFSKGYEGIQTDVSNGIVSVRGSVPSEKDRQIILDRIRKINGVQSVDDQLQVETPQ